MTAHDPAVRKAQSRLANAIKLKAGQAAITEARRDLHEANLADRIHRIVSSWPPLTTEQRDRLALLLRDGGDGTQ